MYDFNKRIKEERCVKCGTGERGKYHILEINKKEFLLCDGCFSKMIEKEK